MRLSPILKYQFAIDIHVISTEGGAALAVDENSANEAVAARVTSLDFMDLSPWASVRPLSDETSGHETVGCSGFPLNRGRLPPLRAASLQAIVISVALPPAAAVLMLSERSTTRRSSGIDS